MFCLFDVNKMLERNTKIGEEDENRGYCLESRG